MADEQVTLSEREIEVLTLVATGASNQDIAQQLVISVNTVKVHLRNIFEKLGVQSRTEATLYAIRCGLVVVEGEEAGPTDEAAEAGEETGTAQAESRGPDWRRGTIPPIQGWQKAFLAVVLVLAAALLVLPELGQQMGRPAVSNPISDRPGLNSSSSYANTTRWVRKADLPVPRTRLALAAHNGWLYAIGGDQESGVTSRVEAYDRVTEIWSPRSPKPTAVSNIGAATIGDQIVVPGGCTGQGDATTLVEAYDPEKDSWAELASMPFPLCAYALAVHNEKMYVFGGWDGSQFLDRVLVYDAEQDSWQELPALPSIRGFAAAGTVKDDIYVLGGYDGEHERADTLVFDVNQEQWSEQSPMSTGRAGLGVAVVDGKVYAIGGGWQNYLATNEQYSPEADRWSSFESPVLGQWRNLGVAALDADIYAVGGWNGDYMSINEAYRALFRMNLPVVIDGN